MRGLWWVEWVPCCRGRRALGTVPEHARVCRGLRKSLPGPCTLHTAPGQPRPNTGSLGTEPIVQRTAPPAEHSAVVEMFPYLHCAIRGPLATAAAEHLDCGTCQRGRARASPGLQSCRQSRRHQSASDTLSPAGEGPWAEADERDTESGAFSGAGHHDLSVPFLSSDFKLL